MAPKKGGIFLLRYRPAFFIILMLFIFIAASGCGGTNEAETPFYPVVRVIDGDTIVVEYRGKEEKVRLIGVNTPEIHHPNKGVERYGRAAASYTKKLLQNKQVRLEFDVQQRDKYGRLLAYVYLPDGTFVNARLVAEGYAQVMTVPPNVRHAGEFRELQRQACQANKGLWGIESKDNK